MARDPLSIQPVVLGDFKTPSVAQGIMQQRIGMEQQKKVKDAEKMARIADLSQVEAMGWERDQTIIDEAAKEYEDMVAQIMYETDGIPDPVSLRRIERSRQGIEFMAKKTVEDKKALQDNMQFINKNYKDLDVDNALEGLKRHYAQPPLQRGVFDFTPYFKEEQYVTSDLLKEMPGGVVTDDVKRDDIKGNTVRSKTQTFKKKDNFQYAIDQLKTDERWQAKYNEYLEAGVVDSPESFATKMADMKEASEDLGNWLWRTRKTSTVAKGFKQEGYKSVVDKVDGREYEFSNYINFAGEGKQLNVQINGKDMRITPLGKGTNDDGDYAVVSAKIIDPDYISSAVYETLDGNAKQDYVAAGPDKYMLKGTNKVQTKTMVIPYSYVDAEIEGSIKDYGERSGIDSNSTRQTEAEIIMNQISR